MFHTYRTCGERARARLPGARREGRQRDGGGGGVCGGGGERGGGDIGAVVVGRARGHGVHGAGALLVPP
jgi:hypothetical protein